MKSEIIKIKNKKHVIFYDVVEKPHFIISKDELLRLLKSLPLNHNIRTNSEVEQDIESIQKYINFRIEDILKKHGIKKFTVELKSLGLGDNL